MLNIEKRNLSRRPKDAYDLPGNSHGRRCFMSSRELGTRQTYYMSQLYYCHCLC